MTLQSVATQLGDITSGLLCDSVLLPSSVCSPLLLEQPEQAITQAFNAHYLCLHDFKAQSVHM